jgi:guanine nucleotide-binding protein G(I)/G(S)/G(T) subunit beta-1
MADVGSSLAERIEQAKKKAQTLKTEIEEVRKQKDNATLPGAAKSQSLPGFGDKMPKVRRVLKGHFGKVYSMHWAHDGTQLVSASQDGKLIIWNAHTTNKNQSIPLRSSWVMTCCFEQTTGSLVACGGLDNVCSVYRVNGPGTSASSSAAAQSAVRPAHELMAHDGYLSCCRFLDERSLLTSSGDSTCIFWDVDKNEAITSFADHGGDVMSLSVMPSVNRQVFVSGSCDATAKVWDIRSGKCVQTFAGHESDVNSVQFFPDGNAVGTGSDDSTCRLFDLRSYGAVNVFGNDKIVSGVTSVGFSASGRVLFAGHDDSSCVGWDTLGEGKGVAFQLAGHESRVSCLGVNSKGEALCTGSWDSLLKVWA